MSLITDKRRPSQQSTSQRSNTSSKKSTKRPKTAKKKKVVVVDLIPDKTTDSVSTKTTDNDLLKTAMFVQHYGSNTTDQNLPSITEHTQLPINLQLKKSPSPLRRSSIKSNDDITTVKHFLDNIDTQITTTTTNEQIEPVKEQQPIIDNKQEQILAPVTNIITENKQQPLLEPVDNRKRVKKGAFDVGQSMNDMIAFELGMTGSHRGAMNKNKFRLGKENKNDDKIDEIPQNQGTLDLLEKIRQSATGVSMGQMPVSQQVCIENF
jgi:hypothetical protein